MGGQNLFIFISLKKEKAYDIGLKFEGYKNSEKLVLFTRLMRLLISAYFLTPR